jgi:hypothetical protein
MQELRLLLAFAILSAACGKVASSSDSGPADHRDDSGSGTVSDAAPPDATPVACDGPEDCANPDDPCLEPGTCEEKVCHFETMNCSELDGECTVGICRDGECEPKAIKQDQACGSGLMDCGAFGVCGAFADVCDESGSESRSCTDSTCQAGECVTGAPYTDSRGCTRDTDGTMCDDTTVDCDGVCNYTSTCDRDDTDVTCVTTDYACAGGTCTPGQTSDVDDCERDTEGLPCGSNGCCSPSGVCVADCV